MSRAAVEELLTQNLSTAVSTKVGETHAGSSGMRYDRSIAADAVLNRAAGPRRAPRKSLIVAVPDNHVVSVETVKRRLLSNGDGEEMDVIVACAGQPRNLDLLKRGVRDVQILLAPAGTSSEDLRELAMLRAEGDIVTLMSGSLPEPIAGD